FIGEGITADISIEGSGQMAVTHDLVVTKSRGTLYVRGSGVVLAETVKMAGTADVRNNGTIYAEDFYVGKGARVKVSSTGQIVATTTLCVGAGSEFTFELDPAGQTHSPIVGAGPGMLGEVLDDNWTTTLASNPIDFDLVLNISAVVEPGTVYTLFESLPFIPDAASPLVVTASSGQQFEKIYDGIGLAVQAIPEPSTYALIGGVGAVALAVLGRRRRRG
ncbi:MAG: PEP-CTERM sorting domain-containing protein, partial [Puniceicoccales bacterium]|nr:PEP-CTERM sorting domain-containing protein [Puniceicoccales bacterium]